MLNEDQFFELNAVGMLIFNHKDFTILRINQKAANIYEYQPSELNGKNLSQIFSDKEISWLRSAEMPEMGNEQVSTFHTHNIKTGQKRFVKLRLNLLHDADHQDQALITFFDITDDVLKNRRLSRQDTFLKIINDFNSTLRKGKNYGNWFEENVRKIGSLLEIQEIEYLEIHSIISKKELYTFDRKFSLDGEGEKWPWPDVPKDESADLFNALQKNEPQSLLQRKLNKENTLNDYLLKRGGKTYLFIPVCSDGNLRGFFCLEDTQNSRTWEKNELDFLSAIAEDLALHLEAKDQRIQIEESEKKFKELVQGGADLIAIIDAEGNYTYVSPSVFNNLGYRAEHFLGKNAFDFIHPDDKEWVASFLEQLLSNTPVSIPPYRFQDASGEWNYLTTVLTDKRDHPQIAGIIANSRNITDVVKVKQELELANERYKMAAYAASDHIYDWDIKTGTVSRQGKSLKTLWGYTPEDVARLEPDFWKKCVHPDDIEIAYGKLQDCLANPKIVNCESQYRFRNANGEYSVILDQGYIIRGDSGEALRLVGAVKDISAIIHKEAEENLYLKIANCFSDKFDLEKCLSETLKVLISNSEAVGAEIWLLATDRVSLNLIQRHESPRVEKFYEECEHINQFAKNEAVPGKVWATEKKLVISSIEKSGVFKRKTAALNSKIKSVVGIPIKRENDFQGVLLLLIDEGFAAIKENLPILENIGLRLGSLVSQKLLEDDLNNFFNLSPDYLCILGADGILKKVNKAIVENTGYSKRELLTKPLRNFLHPADRERGMKQIENALRTDEVNYAATRFIGKNGQAIHLIWSSRMDPKKKQVYAVAKDITLRVNAQHELNLAYNRLRQAQRIAKLGYWSRPMEEKNYWWSEQMYTIYEVSPDTFKPNLQNVLKMVHPEDRAEVEMSLEKILVASNELSYRHRIVSKGGNEKWVLQRLWLRRDETGKIIAIEGTIQDISEQIENEEELRISNERFRLAMTATREMIWDWDHDTNVVTRGMGYDTTFGYNPSETAGKNNSWFGMVHPDDIEGVWKSIQAALKNSSQTQWEAEYRILPEPNSVAYVIDRGFIIRDKNGKAQRSVGSTLDVSQTRKHLKAIERQNQALRDIAHMQSHVIRAPLARIMGLLELAKLEKMNQEAVQNYLSLMAENANDLDRVIRDITAKTNKLE